MPPGVCLLTAGTAASAGGVAGAAIDWGTAGDGVMSRLLRLMVLRDRFLLCRLQLPHLICKCQRRSRFLTNKSGLVIKNARARMCQKQCIGRVACNW